jgi:stress response protein SCP2
MFRQASFETSAARSQMFHQVMNTFFRMVNGIEEAVTVRYMDNGHFSNQCVVEDA